MVLMIPHCEHIYHLVRGYELQFFILEILRIQVLICSFLRFSLLPQCSTTSQTSISAEQIELKFNQMTAINSQRG